MGEIVSSRIGDDGRILFTLSLAQDEALQLRGHINNIFIFSDNAAEIKTNIAMRGKNSATKYFLIPKELRKDLNFPGEVACQKIETKTKTIFIYSIDKLRL
jgi:hypothetical protein